MEEKNDSPKIEKIELPDEPETGPIVKAAVVKAEKSAGNDKNDAEAAEVKDSPEKADGKNADKTIVETSSDEGKLGSEKKSDETTSKDAKHEEKPAVG